MRKIMKCEGFELIWNTLSLSKLKEITRSRFTWRVGTEKRSRTPLFLYNFQHDTPLRIDCISNMLNLHFLPTGKNIVHKSSICPPTWLPFLKLCIQSSLQVFPCMVNGLIQFTWQSGLFIGKPPSSFSSSPVNSTVNPPRRTELFRQLFLRLAQFRLSPYLSCGSVPQMKILLLFLLINYLQI